jgi:hypothetical protein
MPIITQFDITPAFAYLFLDRAPRSVARKFHLRLGAMILHIDADRHVQALITWYSRSLLVAFKGFFHLASKCNPCVSSRLAALHMLHLCVLILLRIIHICRECAAINLRLVCIVLHISVTEF